MPPDNRIRIYDFDLYLDRLFRETFRWWSNHKLVSGGSVVLLAILPICLLPLYGVALGADRAWAEVGPLVLSAATAAVIGLGLFVVGLVRSSVVLDKGLRTEIDRLTPTKSTIRLDDAKNELRTLADEASNLANDSACEWGTHFHPWNTRTRTAISCILGGIQKKHFGEYAHPKHTTTEPADAIKALRRGSSWLLSKVEDLKYEELEASYRHPPARDEETPKAQS